MLGVLWGKIKHYGLGGHGYAVVFAGRSELKVEFVCIPRPLERAERADGGPLEYRVAHNLKLWKPVNSTLHNI